jgi:hypothetical protein
MGRQQFQHRIKRRIPRNGTGLVLRGTECLEVGTRVHHQALRTDNPTMFCRLSVLRVARLLEESPAGFVERAEAQARSDSQFKALLGWILLYETDKPEWERLRRVAGELPND